ncbi:hypothetical protein COCNU_14G006060 [Cocos nucifera]|uniref:Uncharacterized protein n=1 Tax=Cocos nucifera TaxID=13894 RepID=A0A8K0IVA5_COCNU|nr:hypothetical protein COCNU_14G006060 [Cocos nucifera]
MEISLTDTEIDRLQNHSIINNLLHQLPDIGSLCASIVLILAASAAFVGVVRQTELLIFRRREERSGISHPVVAYSDNDSCSSSDDDDDDDDDTNEEGEEVSSSDEYESACGSGICGDDDWGHDGNSGSRPFWQELGLGGAVVKTWEGLGLGIERSSGLISLLDLNRGEVLRSFLPGAGQIPVASLSSPAVVLSAAERVGAAAVKVWDARVGGQAPSATADWRPFRRRRVVGVAGGGERKVYVSDDVGAVSVADLRNLRSPLRDTWWEADAVNVEDLTGSERSGSVVSWCRNAVRCLPLLPSSN